MKLTLPQKMIHENLLLTKDGDIWAYYKIKPKYIASQNRQQRQQSKNTWAYTLNSLKRYGDFHLELYPPERDLSAQYEEFEEDFAEDNKAIGRYYAQETVRLLKKEMGMITYSSFVLGVKLRENQVADNLKEALKESYENVTSHLMSLLGYDVEADQSFFDRFQEAEKNLFSSLGIINAIRMTEEDMIYLNRFNFIRDIDHSMRKESQSKSMYHLSDSVLDPTERMGFLKVSNAEGDSYVSFLPVGEFPVNLVNNHLFALAQEVKFPCEFHLKAHFEQPNGINGLKGKVSGKNRKFKVNTRDVVQDGDSVGKKLSQNRAVLEVMKDDLDTDVPILKWLGCFVVYGKTIDECRKHGDSLIRMLGVRKINVFRPVSDQLELFYKMLQGEPIADYKKWVQYSNAYGISESLFAVTNTIGNNTGWYVGRVDDTRDGKDRDVSLYSSNKIVLLNPIATNQNIQGAVTASPHISITGQTGKGKSYLIKLLFYYLSFMNMKVLYIDPKKEMRQWFNKVIEDVSMQEKYPAFIEHLKSVHYVTLDASSKENWGALDPLVFLDRMQAKETAESMFFQLYDVRGREQAHVAISRAINDVLDRRDEGETVGMLHVVDVLQASEDTLVKACGDLLRESIQDSLLQLGFSYGEHAGVSLDERITILEISGLNLPKADDEPDNYSDVEKKSVCLMLPLGKFCEMFGSQNPKEYTVEFFDEAWIFTVAKGGKQVLKSIKRVGRSMSNMCVLGTQSIHDSDQENQGQEGMIFAFDESSERSEILKYMQLEDTEKNHEWLENMMQGQCLFRDIYGKVGKITVHCLFEEMDLASKTVNKGASGNIEEKYQLV
ncbi:hypothetical protein GCM10025886_14170 [Tetragenococcus halophilus subsp. flandriensis]|uniref:ATP-binding protein n=1 Tax=Tetragenococcus halophilus TaxID=51669 RepID=UPI0023E9503D|nr:ATP-binding protein [Tetragenococcus halophilus]GMA08266.1 hypothetical protein GCM10025886_14170 [Tetragenococcus halophilus subsp. flandriensis]